MSKTLIFGTSYVEGQAARYVFSLWSRLITRLNPGVDVLVVDSASPDLLPIPRETYDVGTITPTMPSCSPSIRVHQLGDNIGHLMKNGRDGWGRAFCKGLELAQVEGYEYAIYIECDVLVARPLLPVIERMKRSGVRVASPMATPYAMPDTAIMAMRVDSMGGFAERYGWETAPVSPLAEYRVAEILGDDLWCLPWRGYRNDTGLVTPKTMRGMFPAGIDWITHAEPAVYREFLRMNGLGDHL